MRNRRHKPEARDTSDAELWRQFTSGVRPLRRSPEARPEPRPQQEAPKELAKGLAANATTVEPGAASKHRLIPPPPRPSLQAQKPALSPGVADGLDQRTLVRLKRGLLRPETQIDLHHMTQAEAHAALHHFLASAQQAGRRCVLVITGKGYGSDGSIGVLKANVPRWLNEPTNRERILAFALAASRDGGEGALYILLRRVRSCAVADPLPYRF